MKRLGFYFKYAWRSVLRGGQRTVFAVVCVSIGVAALVSMQSLAVSIKDTLLGDINALAGGSVVIRGGTQSESAIHSQEQYLDQLKAQGQIQDWTGIASDVMQLNGYFGFPPSLYVIDPSHFPLYGSLSMADPSNGNFKALLAQPNAIIVSKSLFDKNKYKIGQQIQIAASSSFGVNSNNGSVGKSATLTIVGSIQAGAPGLPTDTGIVFGFGIVSPQTATSVLPSSVSTNNGLLYYLKSAPGTTDNELVQNIKYSNPFRGANIQTAAQIQKQIADVLQYLDLLLAIVGLLGILIGGVGVVNTMLVVIGRRTTEIATVKALGLKSRQTLAIFTIEAMILGVLGSVLGVVLGVLLGYGIKGVAEGLFLRPLNWGFYPGPMLAGFLVGFISAGVFGFLPAYAATRVRPAVVLRQIGGGLPRVGGFVTFLIILFMTLAMGIIAGVLVNDMAIGVIGAFVTLLLLSIITLGLYLAVWIVGKLPMSVGPDSKMAFRSFSRHRGRTATTLLVMVVGLFFITFIVIIADSIKDPIQKAFDTNLGYNVIALNLQADQTEQVQTRLQTVPGVNTVFAGTNGSGELRAINGQSVEASIDISGRTLTNGKSLSPNGAEQIIAGRDFQPSDMNQKVLLLTSSEASEYGIKVGDQVTLELYITTLVGRRGNGASQGEQTFKVIGIVQPTNSSFSFERNWVLPYNALSGSVSLFYINIDRTQSEAVLTQIQSMLGNGFVFDLGDLFNTVSHLIDQFLAFPLLLSLLSLFSGAVLIANNVALAMLERRTEIGVLKAIGAKRRRVLNILMWESGLVGFLGGLIGVGVGILIALLIPLLGSATGRGGSSANSFTITWSPLTALLLLLLGIGLAIGATIVSAWGAIQEKPLVVLRYE